jgi:hypothetical protein
LPGSVITGHAIVGGSRSRYPTGDFFPATLADVWFVSLTAGKLSARQYQSVPERRDGREGRGGRLERDGKVFYTSTAAPSYPLLADTSFLTAAGTITNAVISGAR